MSRLRWSGMHWNQLPVICFSLYQKIFLINLFYLRSDVWMIVIGSQINAVIIIHYDFQMFIFYFISY
jgi:hypothetical protein